MTTDADLVAASVETCLRSFVEVMPEHIWRREDAGVLAFISGLGMPPMNSVTVFGPHADLGLVRELLPTVLGSGFPCLLRGRATLREALSEVADELGLVPGEEVPMMMLDEAQEWAPSQRGAPPAFRELATEERHQHAELLAAGFEAPLELMSQLVELFHSAPNFRMHVARLAHAIRFGLASGAAWAWLQASSDGYPLYERMGFRTVENWPTWTPRLSE